MTTNLTIIEDALRDIDVIAETQSASAEQGQYCLRKLNQMMEALKESSVDVGWFAQTLTTATIPIPDWAELGITSALSVVIAPKYGATVSPELVAVATSSMGMIKRKLISEKLENRDMSHMPIGLGQYGYGYDIESG